MADVFTSQVGYSQMAAMQNGMYDMYRREQERSYNDMYRGYRQATEQPGPYTQSAGTSYGQRIEVPIVSATESVKLNPQETKKMADNGWSLLAPVTAVQSYVEKHKEKIITVAAVFLIDHFVFKGKFRVKLEELFEKLVDKLVGAMA